MSAVDLFAAPLSAHVAERLRAMAKHCEDATTICQHRAGIGRLPAHASGLKTALRDCGSAYRAAAGTIENLVADGITSPADRRFPKERMLRVHQRVIDAEWRLRIAMRRAESARRGRPQDKRGRPR